MSLIGVFGGTFDPIHYGHLRTVDQIDGIIKSEHIRFIPAFKPPHRPAPHASAQQRIDMLRLATTCYANYSVDDREFHRDKPSWTIDTLKSLQNEFPRQHLCLIVGMDALIGLPSWHRWMEIFSYAHIIAMHRPGFNAPDPRPDWWRAALITDVIDLYNRQSGHIIEIDIDPISISSTLIRREIRRGGKIDHMLPDSVSQYISKHKLYLEENV